jgi:hypothetical protein
MDLLGAFHSEGFGDSGRISAIDGGAPHVTLNEAYDLSELQVDRGNYREMIKQISYERVPLVESTPDRRGSIVVA